jgi:hypothetical protein
LGICCGADGADGETITAGVSDIAETGTSVIGEFIISAGPGIRLIDIGVIVAAVITDVAVCVTGVADIADTGSDASGVVILATEIGEVVAVGMACASVTIFPTNSSVDCLLVLL